MPTQWLVPAAPSPVLASTEGMLAPLLLLPLSVVPAAAPVLVPVAAGLLESAPFDVRDPPFDEVVPAFDVPEPLTLPLPLELAPSPACRP